MGRRGGGREWGRGSGKKEGRKEGKKEGRKEGKGGWEGDGSKGVEVGIGREVGSRRNGGGVVGKHMSGGWER